MEIKQFLFNTKLQVLESLSGIQFQDFDLHFVFADKSYFDDDAIIEKVKTVTQNSIVAGCSTSGEIHGDRFSENTFSVTSIKFNSTRVRKVSRSIKSSSESLQAGMELANALKADDLKHVFILSDGLIVNGTQLLNGINTVLEKSINVSGGLAGDNAAFVKTYVADDENVFRPGCITAIGFYGEDLMVASSSYGGWDSFGIDRLVTKSVNNVVYEIDNQPALDLYKSYLGEKASELPASAMYFPIEMREGEFSEVLVRTILGINEEEKSLTFAGDVPQNSYVRLMKTNVNRVIDGAGKSAEILKDADSFEPELVVLVSCVGRKIVLKQLTQDEVDAVVENFEPSVHFTGFYSNGEISKMKFVESCKLHNQSMTLTIFSENK